MTDKSSTYETDSKVDLAKLREAVRKVFDYDPSASRKDAVEPQTAKHRKGTRKGNNSSVRS
jgi:hypothetical protein